MAVNARLIVSATLLALFQGSLCQNEDIDSVMGLQAKTEQLIENVIGQVSNYYRDISTENKCIPDSVPDEIMETVKGSIDCVNTNQKDYDTGLISKRAHDRVFLKCFTIAKKQVQEILDKIDPAVDYCPQNATEKTYEINVTTSFMKVFKINIKNGVEVSKRVVETNGPEETICPHMMARDFEAQDEPDETEVNVQDDHTDTEIKYVESKPVATSVAEAQEPNIQHQPQNETGHSGDSSSNPNNTNPNVGTGGYPGTDLHRERRRPDLRTRSMPAPESSDRDNSRLSHSYQLTSGEFANFPK